MINILIFLKEVLDLLNEIYIYIYMYVEGHVAELVPPHTQSVQGLREKSSNCGSQGKNVQVTGLVAYCNYFYIKQKRYRDIYCFP